MENFIKDLRKKLSVDNIVSLMKEANVIDEEKITEEEVRKTLEQINPNNIVGVDEIASKLQELGERAANNIQEARSQASSELDSALNVLKKPTSNEDLEENDEKTKKENRTYEFI